MSESIEIECREETFELKWQEEETCRYICKTREILDKESIETPLTKTKAKGEKGKGEKGKDE